MVVRFVGRKGLKVEVGLVSGKERVNSRRLG